MGTLDVFLSSDSGSVSLGNYWLDNITAGLRPVDLPLPISLLQGFSIDQTVKLQEVFDAIAKKLKLNPPQMDTQLISDQCNQFQTEYSKNQKIKLYLIQIKEKQPYLWQALQENINQFNQVSRHKTIVISNYAQVDYQKIEQYLENLQENKHLEFSFGNINLLIGPVDSKVTYGTLQLQFSDDAIDVLKTLV